MSTSHAFVSTRVMRHDIVVVARQDGNARAGLPVPDPDSLLHQAHAVPGRRRTI